LDIVSDVALAVDYLNREKYVYFGVTLGLVIVPAIITSAFSFCWEYETVKIRNQRSHGGSTESQEGEGNETEIDGEVEPNGFPRWLG
jgi:hypothetical protein